MVTIHGFSRGINMKKSIFLIGLFLCLVGIGYSQVWTYDSDFAYLTGPHGIVIDPEGKIWVCTFYSNGDSVITAEGEVKAVKGLYVFNTDGTQASFSPIISATFDGVTDTLFSGGRGLAIDHNGNILLTAYNEIFLFDYKTGQGLYKAEITEGYTGSLAKPACTGDGAVIIGNITGSDNRPIYYYTDDLRLEGNLIESNVGLQRSMVASKDGTHLYIGKIYTTGNGIVDYYSPDGVGGTYTRIDTFGTVFDSLGNVVKNMMVHSLDWDRNGLLWAGTYWDQNSTDFTGWYALDSTKDWAIVDSIGSNWGDFSYLGENPIGDGKYYSPRGIAWSSDGKTAYICDFDGSVVMKFTNPNPIKPGSYIPSEGEPTEWSVRLKAETAIYSDMDNMAGTSFSVTDGYDEDIDLPEPPTPAQNYVQLFFTHADWGIIFENFKTDIQYPINLLYYQKAFAFSVATDQSGQIHTITIDSLCGLDYKEGVYIQDLSTGEITQLTGESNFYTFTPMSADIYNFKLLIGRLYPIQEYKTEFPAGWNIVALPLTPIDNSISEMFDDDFSCANYFYQYVGDTGYETVSEMEPGKGYWMGLLEAQTLDYEGDSLTTTCSVELNAGNNLVGNPFDYQISKNNLTFSHNDSTLSFENAVSKGWLSAAMHYWDNQSGGCYIAIDSLGRGCGAWMYALADSVVMNMNPAASKSLTKFAKTLGTGDWEVQFALSSTWSNDNTCKLGAYSIASDGFDAALDYPEPPTAPSGKVLTGYFVHEGWSILGPKYDSDIRAVSTGEKRWEYTVYSSTQGSVTLRWELTNIPTTISLVLVDSLADVRIDMLANCEYTFNYQGERIIEIVQMPNSGIGLSTTLPTEYRLSQNFPNPFNPTTTIQYQLPKSGDVVLSVYDLRGELVKTILSGRQNAGYYAVNVDFSDLSSGVYFYRLKASDYVAFRKCMIIK